MLETVKYLVSIGADARAKNDYAVRYATIKGHLEIVKFLVSIGVNIRAELTMIYSSEKGHLEIVKYIVSLGNVSTKCINESFWIASENGHLEIVKYLVSVGADIRFENDRAIRVASKKGYLKIVKFLVSQGANFEAKENSAMCNALWVEDFEMVLYLMSIGVDIAKIRSNHIPKLTFNKLTIICYNRGMFDYAAKLLEHNDFRNDTIRKSLVKIQRDRAFFFDNIKKNYADMTVLFG